jgi:hypothetical protein
MILHEKTKEEFGYEFETASNRSQFYCICDYCGKEFSRIKRTIVQCNQFVVKDSCGIGDCKKKKSEEVQMIKFGVINVGGNKESIKKREQTCLDLYGDKNYINSLTCKQKNINKLGVEYHLQSEDSKNKVKNTKEKSYGVDHHMKNKQYMELHKKKLLLKYGFDHYSKTEEFKKTITATFFDKYQANWYFQSEEFRKLCDENPNKTYGKTQNEIKEYVNSFGFNFTSDRTVLEGKEIDLLDGGIGIEYSGLFWHNEFSPQPRDSSYHYNKYDQCLKKDIRLITIFEDEWKLKNNQCKSILKSILGKNERRVYGRKCTVSVIDVNIFKQFCFSYHLRGACNKISVCFGLFFESELVAVMSLGKHHRSGCKHIVLNRLCFKDGIQVVGGSGKLFASAIKWAKDNGYKHIISWSDNRWSSGGVYKALGFVLDANLKPDYSYVSLKGGSLVRLSKQSCCKKYIDCPLDKTEREHMIELGYARIWDCGKKRWLFEC